MQNTGLWDVGCGDMGSGMRDVGCAIQDAECGTWGWQCLPGCQGDAHAQPRGWRGAVGPGSAMVHVGLSLPAPSWPVLPKPLI